MTTILAALILAGCLGLMLLAVGGVAIVFSATTRPLGVSRSISE